MLDLKTYSATIRVTDGAWGTELHGRGLPAGVPPELWNVENPEAVQAVARSYVEAGSDVILTNTFGGNRFALSPHGAGDRVGELVEAGAAISRNAAGPNVQVFGAIGPTGKIVMMGETPEEELASAFGEAGTALARGGADAIVLETFNELEELRIALEGVKGACDLPVIASMTFASGPEKSATMMGNTPADLGALAEANGADAVGANCGSGPENYVKVTQMLRSATDLPIWIKPNAGVPTMAHGKTVFAMGPEEFAAYVPKLIGAGANFVGGCCGTNPDFIREILAAVDRGK